MPFSRRHRDNACTPASSDRSSREQGGSNSGFYDRIRDMMGGGSAEETPILCEAEHEQPVGDTVGEPELAPLKDYPGYDEDWHGANDELIQRVVAEFNAEKGWDEEHPHYLDPNLVKAWALQESGGHQDIFTGGDMMQVNNPGDWAPEKEWFGLQKRQALDPEQSLRAALDWAYYKGEVTRAGDGSSEEWHPTQRGTKSVPGYESRFTGWGTALDNYNGGGVADYFGDIERRYDSAMFDGPDEQYA